MTWLHKFKSKATTKQEELDDKVSKSQSLLDDAIAKLGGAAEDLSLTLRLQIQDFNAQLKLVGKLIDEGLLVFGSDGLILSANTIAEQMFGYTGSTMVGMSICKLFHHKHNLTSSPKCFFDYLYNPLPEDHHHTDQGEEYLHGLKQDETKFYADVSISNFEKSTGGKQFILLVRDISAKISTQNRFAELTKKYSNLVHAINRSTQIGVVVTTNRDDGCKAIFANQGYTRITGYQIEETLGRTCNFLQGADTEKRKIEEIRSGLDTGEDFFTQITNYKKDGTKFINKLNISPIKDRFGKVEFYVGIIEDITERVMTLRELKDKNQKLEEAEQTRINDLLKQTKFYESILSNIPMSISLKNEKGQYLYVNDYFCNLNNMRYADVIGRTLEDVFAGEPLKARIKLSSDAFEIGYANGYVPSAKDPTIMLMAKIVILTYNEEKYLLTMIVDED